MIKIENLGNIEFINAFLTLHYLKYGLKKTDVDIRILEPNKISYIYLSNVLNISPNDLKNLKTSKNIDKFYNDFLIEATKRGFNINLANENMLDNLEFKKWFFMMKNEPTYMREINATNYSGNYDASYKEDDYLMFDFPVRLATRILNEKGYVTYWSSANLEDFMNRRGQVVKDQAVAYILIDPANLTDSLKQELLLNGSCDFWGIALEHSDNGKYYGIYANIESLNMRCCELSDNLANIALKLPSLSNMYTKK